MTLATTQPRPAAKAAAAAAARLPRRRGVAVPMVLSVVAVAVVLAHAMLTAAATRSAMARNAATGARLEQLAESGLHYATHFLRYPNESGAGHAGWFQPDRMVGRAAGSTWPAGGGTFTVNAAPALPGSFDLRVTWLGYVPTDRTLSDFTVESTGRIGGESRKLTATVRRRTAFVPQAALTVKPNVTLTSGVRLVGGGGKPAFFANPGRLTIPPGAVVTGNVWTPLSPLNSGSLFGSTASPADGFYPLYLTGSSGVAIPGTTTIPLLEQMPISNVDSTTADNAARTYSMNGRPYTAAKLPDGYEVTSAADLPVDLVSNPGRVYYSPGDLTIRSPAGVIGFPPDLALTATFVVRKTLFVGALTETGLLQKIDVTPVAGMPAIVAQEVAVAGLPKTLTIRGLVHVVDRFRITSATAATSAVRVDGALMFENPSSSPFGSTAWAGTIQVTHDPTNLNVPGFSTASNQVVQNVAVLDVR